jgi:hypothetical protein
VDLLTHFSDEYYPSNIFKKQDRFGQVEYFLAAFPSKEFAMRIRKHISAQVSQGIKTFDEFLVHFLNALEKVEKHFKVDRKLMDTLVYGQSADKPMDTPNSSTKKYEYNRTMRFQKVNALEDAATSSATEEFVHDLLDGEIDIVNDDSDDIPDAPPAEEEDEDTDNVDASPDVTDDDTPAIELSPALNAMDRPKTPTLVCYAKVNHGVCSNKECKYSHDDALINKFKAQYKDRQQQKKGPPSGTNAKVTTTPQRKFGMDNKRRA